MKYLLPLIILSGCSSALEGQVGALEKEIQGQRQAIYMLGIKLAEHEAKIYPDKARAIYEALQKGEAKLELPKIEAPAK